MGGDTLVTFSRGKQGKEGVGWEVIHGLTDRYHDARHYIHGLTEPGKERRGEPVRGRGGGRREEEKGRGGRRGAWRGRWVWWRRGRRGEMCLVLMKTIQLLRSNQSGEFSACWTSPPLPCVFGFQETDYIMSYFDNGEGFGGDSDDNMDEATFWFHTPFYSFLTLWWFSLRQKTRCVCVCVCVDISIWSFCLFNQNTEHRKPPKYLASCYLIRMLILINFKH